MKRSENFCDLPVFEVARKFPGQGLTSTFTRFGEIANLDPNMARILDLRSLSTIRHSEVLAISEIVLSLSLIHI